MDSQESSKQSGPGKFPRLEELLAESEIPKIPSVPERKKQILYYAKPAIAIASTMSFFYTAYRLRMRLQGKLKWDFELKAFDTEEKIRESPRLYASIVSARCFTNSTALVSTASLAVLMTACTIYDINSLQEAFIRFRLASERLLPKIKLETPEHVKAEEEKFLKEVHEYLENYQEESPFVKKYIIPLFKK